MNSTAHHPDVELQRSGATEHTRGKGPHRDNEPLAVARQTAFAALRNGNTLTENNGSSSSATVCGATNTFMEKGRL
jgi:polyribonucleotide nucleotidyltransferase